MNHKKQTQQAQVVEVPTEQQPQAEAEPILGLAERWIKELVAAVGRYVRVAVQNEQLRARVEAYIVTTEFSPPTAFPFEKAVRNLDTGLQMRVQTLVGSRREIGKKDAAERGFFEVVAPADHHKIVFHSAVKEHEEAVRLALFAIADGMSRDSYGKRIKKELNETLFALGCSLTGWKLYDYSMRRASDARLIEDSLGAFRGVPFPYIPVDVVRKPNPSRNTNLERFINAESKLVIRAKGSIPDGLICNSEVLRRSLAGLGIIISDDVWSTCLIGAGFKLAKDAPASEQQSEAPVEVLQSVEAQPVAAPA